MRSKTEIQQSTASIETLVLEVLLDVRDLLQKANKKPVRRKVRTKNKKGGRPENGSNLAAK